MVCLIKLIKSSATNLDRSVLVDEPRWGNKTKTSWLYTGETKKTFFGGLREGLKAFKSTEEDQESLFRVTGSDKNIDGETQGSENMGLKNILLGQRKNIPLVYRKKQIFWGFEKKQHLEHKGGTMNILL